MEQVGSKFRLGLIVICRARIEQSFLIAGGVEFSAVYQLTRYVVTLESKPDAWQIEKIKQAVLNAAEMQGHDVERVEVDEC